MIRAAARHAPVFVTPMAAVAGAVADHVLAAMTEGRRLGRAYDEIAHWDEYDYIVVNDDFDLAYADLAHIYHAERLRRARNPSLTPFVQRLLDEKL